MTEETKEKKKMCGLAKPSMFCFIAIIGVALLLLAMVAYVLFCPIGGVSDREFCTMHLSALGTSIVRYESNFDDTVFTESNWCDVVIDEADGDPVSFICKESGAVYGESSYALNKNALGKKLSELPADIVILFDTRRGVESGERKSLLRERDSFGSYLLVRELFTGDEKVYLDRWNQVGGAEDLTVDNHEGRGCNVLFGDGHVEFVKTEDVGKLRWTVE